MESFTTTLEVEVGIDYRYFEDYSGPGAAEDWIEYQEIELSIGGKIIEGLWNALPPHLRQEIYEEILSNHR